jgi:Mu-like prophage major head subunit gpT
MIIRGNYQDLFFETMLPAINAVLWQAFKKKPKMYDKIFNVESSTRSIEQFTSVSGVGLFVAIPESGEVRFDQPVQGFNSTFKHQAFGLGIEFSRELVEDDKFGQVRRASAELGNSGDETTEIQAASVFNNGFSGSFPGPDGVPLFSLSHPLWKAGGVQPNTLAIAADLDVTSLEIALTDWELTRKANGALISLPVPRLLVGAQNRWNAFEILKGTFRSDTANHTINAFKYGENGPVDEIVVWPRLSDVDAWFLVAPPASNGLQWFWRIKPESHPIFDQRTLRGGTWMRFRNSFGWNDFYGVYGSPGA